MKKNPGITLIALIITIIIMLILVAVSISILINSGLIGKAKEAGSKTKTAYEQESRMGDSITIDGVTYNSIDEYLADLNSSNPAGAGTLSITTNEIETESRAVIIEVTPTSILEQNVESNDVITLVCNGQSVEVTGQNPAEFVITKNGEYTVVATNQDNEIDTGKITATHCKIEEFSSIQNTKQTLTIDGFTVTIPAGFAYGTSENVGHVTTGLVITDSVEVVDGKNYSNGNEFVWIPVDENLKVGTASNNKVMARISSGTDYEGVLYDFNGTGNSTTSTEKSNYGVSTTSWREPAIVAYDTGEYSSQGITLSSLQNEYNAMIASVKTNKGFYVGRYEMGIENGNAVSKLGITPTTAYDEETNMWYGLYKKAKTYTNSSNSVQSHMIWGAEYDAMLNFALEDTNENTNSKGKVTSTEYGNYGGKPLKTGTTETSDKIINIYDLGGNLFEWTAEAHVTSYRVDRGRRYLR